MEVWSEQVRASGNGPCDKRLDSRDREGASERE